MQNKVIEEDNDPLEGLLDLYQQNYHKIRNVDDQVQLKGQSALAKEP